MKNLMNVNSITHMTKRMARLLLCSAAALSFSAASWADIAVITHPSIADSASKKDIARIYLGKAKSLPQGSRVTPIGLNKGNPAHGEFNAKVLGKSEGQLKSYWSKLIFTGKGQPPKEFASDAEIIAKVASDPSIIGFVSSASVNGSVKVIHSF